MKHICEDPLATSYEENRKNDHRPRFQQMSLSLDERFAAALQRWLPITLALCIISYYTVYLLIILPRRIAGRMSLRTGFCTIVVERSGSFAQW